MKFLIRIVASFFLVFCFAAAFTAQAQEQLDADTHEAILRVPVSFKDTYGKEYNASILVTIFKPDGDGPFPLVIINHGRAGTPEARAKLVRSRYESAARYFVRKGFVVALPTRLGYGDQPELGDPERLWNCTYTVLSAIMEVSSSQAMSVIAYMQKQPYVDPHKLVIAGQSVGGFMSVALAAKRSPGLLAAINFAGGHGGDPVNHPGVPCNPGAIGKVYADYGATHKGLTPVPMIFIYTQNDQFFSPKYTEAWHAAYIEAGGKADYLLQPPNGENGHGLFTQANDLWQPMVDTFLAKVGFDKPGVITPPAATHFAKLDDVAALPHASANTKEKYGVFLTSPKPRAAALSDNGRIGYAFGDDALSKALGYCQRETGVKCRFYAVGDEVVW